MLEDNVPAPLYRLPVAAYEVAYPVLLADGDVSEEEVLILGRFFGWVYDINRGLDYAAQAHMNNEFDKRRQEFDRNQLKAKDLLGKYTAPATEVVKRRIESIPIDSYLI